MNFLRKKSNTSFFRSIALRSFVVSILFFYALFSVVYANNVSSSFQIENPNTVIQGGESFSSSFTYLSSTGSLSTGQSDSVSFLQNAGFLYFPTATSPIVSATAGAAQVVLSWTASNAVFANVTSYEVGVSVSSGGVYNYTDVGNVLTYTKTGLTAGTPYFFKVRTYAAGILLTESAVVSATPTASAPVVVTPPSSGSGSSSSGGGSSVGSSVILPTGAKVIFAGRAYPNSSVTLLKDAQVVATTYAGSDAAFNVELNNLTAGSYVFGCYSVDKNGVRSTTQSFPVVVTEGVTMNIGGIFITPTLSGDKIQVKQGDNITFFGQAVPSSNVTISVHSAREIFNKVITDKNGVYLKTFDTSELEMGNHNAKSKVAFENEISDYGVNYPFVVGTENIEANQKNKCPAKGDLNNDCKVNLVDFSIAAFWYKKTLTVQGIALDKNKLNGDGKINLVDFSVMAYYWTG